MTTQSPYQQAYSALHDKCPKEAARILHKAIKENLNDFFAIRIANMISLGTIDDAEDALARRILTDRLNSTRMPESAAAEFFDHALAASTPGEFSGTNRHKNGFLATFRNSCQCNGKIALALLTGFVLGLIYEMLTK